MHASRTTRSIAREPEECVGVTRPTRTERTVAGVVISKRPSKAAGFKVSLVLRPLVSLDRTTQHNIVLWIPAILRLERGMWLVDRPRPKGACCVAKQTPGPCGPPHRLALLSCTPSLKVTICDRASPVPILVGIVPHPCLDSGMFHWWIPSP
ncbi:hypothetical protein BO78DRAFT_73620 [Aspergillus sclerotiicarbonarius CBS 121057]|uniref:Uncharacterized protein n=1 Tax=Aspergillus sclerotiicarbonarius (strain CBS 121057 / IBT 28362) TaxID=1448318 RepID=A0A319EE62_ASPSB|nr:hypothetical protein BO78DRAFT_73620 [Aspergillus sclerotiicarbonarius CBS 121057]